MSNRPVIPVRPEADKPSPEALAQLDRRWRLRYRVLVPHLLGFFLAMLRLLAAFLWHGVAAVWGTRRRARYGRQRVDGRSG